METPASELTWQNASLKSLRQHIFDLTSHVKLLKFKRKVSQFWK